jgi:hypothetical protein
MSSASEYCICFCSILADELQWAGTVPIAEEVKGCSDRTCIDLLDSCANATNIATRYTEESQIGKEKFVVDDGYTFHIAELCVVMFLITIIIIFGMFKIGMMKRLGVKRERMRSVIRRDDVFEEPLPVYRR